MNNPTAEAIAITNQHAIAKKLVRVADRIVEHAPDSVADTLRQGADCIDALKDLSDALKLGIKERQAIIDASRAEQQCDHDWVYSPEKPESDKKCRICGVYCVTNICAEQAGGDYYERNAIGRLEEILDTKPKDGETQQNMTAWQHPQRPDGGEWRWVPSKLTPEMKAAWTAAQPKGFGTSYSLGKGYAAMLAAAPEWKP